MVAFLLVRLLRISSAFLLTEDAYNNRGFIFLQSSGLVVIPYTALFLDRVADTLEALTTYFRRMQSTHYSLEGS